MPLVYLAIGAAFVILLRKIWIRLRLSRAKHPSVRGHAKMSRRIAKQIPFYEYSEDEVFRADNAPDAVAEQRMEAFKNLSGLFGEREPVSMGLNEELEHDVSDVSFTNAYRVPFQFRNFVSRHLRPGSFLQKSEGPRLQDGDGNWTYDLTGSYGVNVFGYDFYKGCMERAQARVGELGPVLGSYHPIIAENVRNLKATSGLDEVSFHMSGTEAVMQAVRLARYHTRRSHIVRFCGAYHGWWDGVQPGIGNQRVTNDVYTLKDMSEDTMRVLRTRKDIACVLVNPLQALHPNGNPPSDAMLIAGDRSAHYNRKAYTRWLHQLRDVCTERSIVLLFDEVFLGFRLARRGAQEYFGVKADMVTYGKTLGGGLPVGVVCGSHELMKRYRDDRPSDICFARGTFNSHPYVMAAMHEFFTAIDSPDFDTDYQELDRLWVSRLEGINGRMREADLPVEFAGMSSIWTTMYKCPGRYHWMFQYYLRAEGLTLPWIGTGRFIFQHNLGEEDFHVIADKIVAAGKKMKEDGWWWFPEGATNKMMKRKVMKELLSVRFSKA